MQKEVKLKKGRKEKKFSLLLDFFKKRESLRRKKEGKEKFVVSQEIRKFYRICASGTINLSSFFSALDLNHWPKKAHDHISYAR